MHAAPSPFAKRLHKLARARDLNGKEAAKLFGLTEPTLSRWLTGARKNPGIALAAKIARRTGCGLEWLLTGKRPAAAPRCIKRLTQIMSRKRKAS